MPLDPATARVRYGVRPRLGRYATAAASDGKANASSDASFPLNGTRAAHDCAWAVEPAGEAAYAALALQEPLVLAPHASLYV